MSPAQTVVMEQLMTTSELAAALGIARHTLENWRSSSRGPGYFRLEGSIRYRMSDVEAWLAGQRVETLDSLRKAHR